MDSRKRAKCERHDLPIDYFYIIFEKMLSKVLRILNRTLFKFGSSTGIIWFFGWGLFLEPRVYCGSNISGKVVFWRHRADQGANFAFRNSPEPRRSISKEQEIFHARITHKLQPFYPNEILKIFILVSLLKARRLLPRSKSNSSH